MKYEKIMGISYRVGSKGWQIAKIKVQQFNDLAASETN